jgi:hypothetical protein
MHDAVTQDAGTPATPPRRRAAAWPFVIHEAVLPLVLAILAFVLFTRMEQAHEALFGTIGRAPATPDAAPHVPVRYVGTPFYAFAGTVALFGTALWYAARLLLTVDGAHRRPFAAHEAPAHAVLVRATELYPRLLGAAGAAALVLALVAAQEGRTTGRAFGVLAALLATGVPLAGAVLALRRKLRGRSRAAAVAAALAAPWIGVIASSPATYSPVVVAHLAVLCYLAPLLYAGFTLRRTLLVKLGTCPRPAAASLPFTWSAAVLRLAGLGIGGAVLLERLANGAPGTARMLGSAAIVLLAITALLCTSCALTLGVRRLANNRPGYLLIAATAALALYLLLHALFGWSPFRERVGAEALANAALPPPVRIVQRAQDADVVVNAYGGGLRAALFTAQVLAALDDRSCGAFGPRLERLSGVSGGSLGIAVYLLLRQEFVASGGWTACTPNGANPARLGSLVEDVLVQDHLSAALARMLSTDVVPWTTPQRGQALLDSWQDALTSVLSARARAPRGGPIVGAGLALPLRLLDGGIAPAPTVFFNATAVASGERVWFSNRGDVAANSGAQPLPAPFQVGQAVLHSARFPVVSPAGGAVINGQAVELVDGGYADNSGAATLQETDRPKPGRHWLDIDGNPPDRICPATDPEPSRSFFSGLDALLAVRRSQARLAVRRYRQTGLADVPLQPDNDRAFAATKPDPVERCAFVRAMHGAPLGWYLTPVTVGDQALAKQQAVDLACEALRPLCGP